MSELSTRAPRRFVAATSREALRLARESLGVDAMVLASRAIAGGVEVVAIAEEAAEALAGSAAEPVAAPALPVATPQAQHADPVLSEIHSMRSMIEERLASVVWSDQQRRDPVRGRLLRTLLGGGFSARLAQAMLEKLPAGQSYADGLAFVRSELIRAVPVHDDEERLLAEGGVYALVGPTGVGKTTTTAKLAARCVMRFGAERLALVTTDGYRIGAYEQLRIYGQILGVPVHAVRDSANLQVVLRDLRDKHMVLIDTVGMSQRDRAVSEQIAMLCSAGRPVKRLLLLNAASHGDTLNEVVYAYQQAGDGSGLAGCIFTKLDEAHSQGALLDTVIRHRLPVHYLSNGQKVPENLFTPERVQLVDDALRPPPPGALFAAEAIQGEALPEEARAEVAHAQAESERLKLRYRQLIRAMAHDAEEVSAAATALGQAGVGFGTARSLWAAAADAAIQEASTARELLQLARDEALAACDTHVIAVCGRAKLDSSEHGDGFEVQGALLLSDRTGLPVAAPRQWLATAGSTGLARPVEWLRQQDLGRPLLHALARLPAAGELARWTAAGHAWLARAPGSTQVIDPRSGDATQLAQLGFAFVPGRPTTFRGKPARTLEAELQVLLKQPDGSTLPLRCIVRRTLAADHERTLEECYALSNADIAVPAARLSQWQAWAVRAEGCFRLTAKGAALLGAAEPGGETMMKRLLVAGQVATTAWRVLHAEGPRADRTRVLLAELAGRQVRVDRPQSGNGVYEGLAKLMHLLEALGAEAADGAALGIAA